MLTKRAWLTANSISVLPAQAKIDVDCLETRPTSSELSCELRQHHYSHIPGDAGKLIARGSRQTRTMECFKHG